MSFPQRRTLDLRAIDKIPCGSGRKRRMDPAAKNSEPMRRAKNEWGSLKEKKPTWKKRAHATTFFSIHCFPYNKLFLSSDCSFLSLVFSLASVLVGGDSRTVAIGAPSLTPPFLCLHD